MSSFRTPELYKRLFPRITWEIPTNEKILYLTFDDGPDLEATPYALDQLERYQAKATFFLIGRQVVQHPDLAKTIVSAGHAVGNHSFSHLHGWKVSAGRYRADFYQGEEVLKRNGLQSALFRPPYGRPHPFVLSEICQKSQVIMWSLLTRDYEPDLDIKSAFEALKTAKSGSIILFHTSQKALSNLKKLLPDTLKYFSDLGYSFQAIP